MDNQQIKALALEGNFSQLEAGGSLDKALKWLTSKLQGLRSSSSAPPTKFADFLLSSCGEFNRQSILEKSVEWKDRKNAILSDSLDEEEEEEAVGDVGSASGVPADMKDTLGSLNVAPLPTLALLEEPKTGGGSGGFNAPAKKSKFAVPSTSSPTILVTKISPEKAAKSEQSKTKFKPKSKPKSKPAAIPVKVKKEKDPLAPKPKTSAYGYFCSTTRLGLKESQPSLKPNEMMQELGRAWNSASEAIKAPFYAEAEKDSKRFAQEMEDYRLNNPQSFKERASSTIKEKGKSKKTTNLMSTIAESDDSDADATVLALGSRKRSSRSADEKSYADLSDEETETLVEATTKSSSVTITPPKRPKTGTKASLQSAQKDRLKKAAQASANLIASSDGLKQDDLLPEDDLLHCELVPNVCVAFPPDYMPALGTSAVLVLKPYRDFLSSLTLESLSSEQREAIEKPCASSDNVLRGTIMQVTANLSLSLCGTSTVVLRVREGLDFNLLFAPFSSPLLQTDEFLLDSQRYDASLVKPYLIAGAQVRKMFALPPSDSDGESSFDAQWMEGSLYYVPSTMHTDPFQCLKVVWLSQEKDTADWVFAYLQTDCDVSPWDLEPSSYVLPEENVRPRKLPGALKIGKLDPAVVLDYFKSLDCADIFRPRLADSSEEYRKLFPRVEDQLDLQAISHWLKQGRYHGHGDSISSSLGISALLRDLERMVQNAKQFNDCNHDFLPWRIADMADAALASLRAQLVVAHPELSACLLEQSSLGLESDLQAEI
jgi:hypothetical protein